MSIARPPSDAGPSHVGASHVGPSHAGVRTCVGCGNQDERSALVRVVADRRAGNPEDPVSVVPDERAVLPGRGAWLHPAAGCLERAIRRRAFTRALRLTQSVRLDAVQEFVDRRTAGADPAQGRAGAPKQ